MAGSFMGAVPGSRPFHKMPSRTTSKPSDAMEAASAFVSTLVPLPLVTISSGGSLYTRSTPCMRTTRPWASRRNDPPGALMGAFGPAATGESDAAPAEPDPEQMSTATNTRDIQAACARRGIDAPPRRCTTAVEASTVRPNLAFRRPEATADRWHGTRIGAKLRDPTEERSQWLTMMC